MAGVRNKPEKNGKYRAWYIDRHSKQVQFTGVRSKAETIRIARKKEDDERQIRLGYRDAPSPEKGYSRQSFDQTLQEYFAWGNAQGGHRCHAWSPVHFRNLQTRLGEWKRLLNLEIMADVYNRLPDAEEILRRMKRQGLSGKPLGGKTLNEYSSALKTFCNWCVKRKYLSENPFQPLERFATKNPKVRAWRDDEVHNLLSAAAVHRRLLYAVAFCTGLRKNELTQLTVDHIDFNSGDFSLDEEWTKNRESEVMPLPVRLLGELEIFCATGEAKRLYSSFYQGKGRKAKIPTNPLLYVPSHTSRDLAKDMAVAGIEVENKEGRLVFHNLRKAFCTLVMEEGGNLKETQDLTRHKTQAILTDRYLSAKPERKRELVEKVASRVLPQQADTEYALSMQPAVTKIVAAPVTTKFDSELQAPVARGGKVFDSRRLHHTYRDKLISRR
jgi:integrase